MSTIHRARRAAFGIAAVLVGAFLTPLVVTAEEQALAVAPPLLSQVCHAAAAVSFGPASYSLPDPSGSRLDEEA